MSTSEPGQAPRGGVHRSESQSRSVLLPILGVLAVLAALGLAGYMLVTNVGDGDDPVVAGSDSTPTQTPTSTAKPTKSATASAEPTKDPSKDPTNKATKKTKKPTKTPTAQPVPAIGVFVFNQTTITGLAAQYAAQLQSSGWNVAGVSNWRGSVPEDTVYYYPGDQAAAQQLAADANISRVWPASSPMHGNSLTLILANTDRS